MNKSQKIAFIVLAAITILPVLLSAFYLSSQWEQWGTGDDGKWAFVALALYLISGIVITILWLSVCHDILYYLADKSRKIVCYTVFHIVSTTLSSLLFVWCIYALNELDLIRLGDLITSLFRMLFGAIGSPNALGGAFMILLAPLSFVVLIASKLAHFIIWLTRRSIKTRKIVKAYEAEHASDSCQL
ncbi:MAG: hypothetical protein LUE25_06925 [Clostridiales bacterium]|nr:hypothetical protein [Clostridiales bacterium]